MYSNQFVQLKLKFYGMLSLGALYSGDRLCTSRKGKTGTWQLLWPAVALASTGWKFLFFQT